MGPDQLAIIQRWPAYRDCIENESILYIVMYIAIALTNFNARVTSGIRTLEDITNTKALIVVNCNERNTEANFRTYQSSRSLCHGCDRIQLCSGTYFKDNQ